ncbi:MAG: type II toxin-antitoxin system VapC family toxin [Methanococcoides sp.]|nr:type II toxin-antitoxin system VapC family toxin [Methanococcoides sp.]MDL2122640.1 type II toxin-antitoxin system VapC family toxin [Deltaproteobacteria bacterium]
MIRLLDTNTCIYFLNRASEKVVQQFKELSPSQIKLPSITVAELYYGAEKSKFKAKNREKVKRFVSTFEIVSFDEKACTAYAKIRHSLERSGTPVGPMDLLIASIGLAYNFTVVTNNIKEFKRVKGLKLQNWV